MSEVVSEGLPAERRGLAGEQSPSLVWDCMLGGRVTAGVGIAISPRSVVNDNTSARKMFSLGGNSGESSADCFFPSFVSETSSVCMALIFGTCWRLAVQEGICTGVPPAAGQLIR